MADLKSEKDVWLNKLRQTKEYQGSSEGRKYLDNLDPVKQVMAQQIDEELETPEEIEKIQKELEYKEWANEANNSEQMKENRKFKNIAGDEDLIQSAKEMIVNKLHGQFYDIIFQAVADEMNSNYMFRENNYFTEAGMDEFEDAWFEWYHNHHGDILVAVLKNLGH